MYNFHLRNRAPGRTAEFGRIPSGMGKVGLRNSPNHPGTMAARPKGTKKKLYSIVIKLIKKVFYQIGGGVSYMFHLLEQTQLMSMNLVSVGKPILLYVALLI